jgi:hypothetical protein
VKSETKKRRKKDTHSAWVVFWTDREDKVAKCSGKVICLLPASYRPETVQRIIEAIYSSYVQSYLGQLEFACFRRRTKLLVERGFRRVTIAENPGLMAVLSDDVLVESNTSGIVQTISWTDPDFYSRTEGTQFIKTQDGAKHSHTFNHSNSKYGETEN